MSPLPLALRGVGGESAVARGVEDLDAIAALGLGDVQRDVGAARDLVEQHVAGFDSSRGPRLSVTVTSWSSMRSADRATRRAAVPPTGAPGPCVHVREQHQEFLAAVAPEDLARVQRGAQRRGETLQQLVADGVAEAIVDRLEVIEIDEPDDQRAARLARTRQVFAPPCARWRGD